MRRVISSLTVVVMLCASANAALLLNYNTDNIGNTNAMPVESTDPGLDVSDMTRGAGLGATSGHSLDSFSSHLNGAQVTNLAQALTGNRYVTWTVTPLAGRAVNYSNLTFYFFLPEHEDAGVVYWSPFISLFSDAIGYTQPDMIGQVDMNVQPGQPTSLGPFAFDLSGESALQNVTSPTEFRLYYHSKYARHEAVSNRPNFWEPVGIGTANGGTNALNALFMEGLVVPEPAVLGVAGICVVLFRKRAVR